MALDVGTSVPSVSAILDHTMPIDFFKQDILELIKSLRIHKWWKKNLTTDNLVVTRLSGALTNAIFKLSYLDSSVKVPSLLLRVYGRNVESLIDRDSELQVLMKLSQKRIGPRLLAIFTNGRFEQFLEGYEALSKESIRDRVISQMLARRMKDLHYKIELEESDYPIDKKTQQVIPTCWKNIHKWLDVFERDFLPHYNDNEAIKETFCGLTFQKFRELVTIYEKWLFAKYDTASIKNDVKFCHNDTQYGNLLLNHSFDLDATVKDEGNVITTDPQFDTNLAVIDFEYSGPNYPALDISNFFCEWMSDYYNEEKPYWIFEDQYPSQVDQLNFIKSYIEYQFQYPSSSLQEGSKPQTTVSEFDDSHEVAAEMIKFEMIKLYNECIYWRMSVSFFWLLWGIIQAGPPKQTDPSTKEPSMAGVNTKYNIVANDNALSLDEYAIEEEAEAEAFDYLRYSQQKLLVALGDGIQLGIFPEDVVSEQYQPLIKKLNVGLLDI